MNKTGFAVAEMSVGVGLIPDFGMEFVHVHDLEKGERAALLAEIDAHVSEVGGPIGYLERHMLRVLMEAGEYARTARLHSVEVSIFSLLPIPKVELHFDPFAFHERREMDREELREDLDTVTQRESRLEQREAVLEQEVRRLVGGTDAPDTPDAGTPGADPTQAN